MRIIVRGRVFEAVRALFPGGKSMAWCLPPPAKGGAITWLHTMDFGQDHKDGWVPTPESWQPSVPGWTWPNGVVPEPLPSCEDRMWSSTLRFAAVEEAEAADLARDMERDRADACRQSMDDDPDEADTQRWRDVHEVAYREPGKITAAEVEARVCRALCYDRIIPHDIKRQRSNAAVLADLKRWLDVLSADPTDDYRPPFRPTAEDYADYLIVMDWIAEAYVDKPGGWAGSDECEIMAGRVLDPPKAWTEIGEALGMSRQGAKKRYDKFLRRLTSIANGGGTAKLAAVADEVQSRNRAWKRLAGGAAS